MRNYPFSVNIVDCVETLKFSSEFYKYNISELYYNNICEIYEMLNNSKNILPKSMIENILVNSRWNLTFTNLISEMYSNVLFFLLLLDTYQIRKYQHIRQKNINFLRKYLISLNDTEFNETIQKNYNILNNNSNKSFFVDSQKNKKICYNILVKFLLARRFFEKLYFTILEKRYAPQGPGYFEAKLSFERVKE